MLRFLVFLHIIPFLFFTDITEYKKEELKIEVIAPTTVEKGSEITVELKITGGSVKGFAKLTDRFPQGIIAESVELGDATFTFSNGVLKVIWLDFPQEKSFSIKYKLKVGPAAPDQFDIGGKFSFLENNQKQSYSVQKLSVTAGSSEQLAQSQAEQVKEEIPAKVAVSRNIESIGEDKYRVTLKVNKEGIEGFSKIQEFTSLGGKMTQDKTEGAVFSFIKNKGKFVWMTIPDGSFEVSYQLDLSNAKDKDPKSIRGDFSFLDGDVTKKVEVTHAAEEALLAKTESSEQTKAPEDEPNTVSTENTQNSEPNNKTNEMASNDDSNDTNTNRTDVTNHTEDETVAETTKNNTDTEPTNTEEVIVEEAPSGKVEESPDNNKATDDVPANDSQDELADQNEETTEDQEATTSDDAATSEVTNETKVQDTPTIVNTNEDEVADSDNQSNDNTDNTADVSNATSDQETMTNNTSTNDNTDNNNTNNTVEESIVADEPITVKEAPVVAQTNTKTTDDFQQAASQTVGNNKGVNYRVQIAAGKNVVDNIYFEKRHNWTTEFVIENHDGWVKYTTGKYFEYKDARDNRELINAGGHKFDGPFVTAYNQGTRITVQEALMISGQKWFK